MPHCPNPLPALRDRVMPLASPPMNSYDEMPYESHPYAQTHPSRLAVVARLFGLQPPAVETCRVLELASAAGGNIVPIAEAFPASRWIGIDLSQRQIDDGQRLVHKLGLKNVALRRADIMEVDDSYGEFDYIIAHGVFSWVPTEVREKILDICSKRLAPNGVAYISFNTYPGWHMRGMIRDMMQFHANRFTEPRQRVQQARALLDFLATSVRQEGPYSALLKSELDNIRNQTDNYLYHEHLEHVNDPLYFHQFVSMARRHGMRYLGEARLPTMVTGNFGPEVQKTLKSLAPDQIQTEQYMDFLRAGKVGAELDDRAEYTWRHAHLVEREGGEQGGAGHSFGAARAIPDAQRHDSVDESAALQGLDESAGRPLAVDRSIRGTTP
jgi:SAM-dependent methyltransferase